MKVTPHFTPGEDIEPIVCGLLRSAERFVRVQGYGFTSAAIADTLIALSFARIDVQVILDGPNEFEKSSKGHELTDHNVPVLYDRAHAISHNKVIIIDGLCVITGSYNWTDGARKRNAENIVVIHDSDTAEAYLNNWLVHFKHSVPPGSKGLGALDIPPDVYGDAEPPE